MGSPSGTWRTTRSPWKKGASPASVSRLRESPGELGEGTTQRRPSRRNSFHRRFNSPSVLLVNRPDAECLEKGAAAPAVESVTRPPPRDDASPCSSAPPRHGIAGTSLRARRGSEGCVGTRLWAGPSSPDAGLHYGISSSEPREEYIASSLGPLGPAPSWSRKSRDRDEVLPPILMPS